MRAGPLVVDGPSPTTTVARSPSSKVAVVPTAPEKPARSRAALRRPGTLFSRSLWAVTATAVAPDGVDLATLTSTGSVIFSSWCWSRTG